jgi:hypothetical protein
LRAATARLPALLAALLGGLLAAGAAGAREPNYMAAPTFGTVTLAGGFVPDPNVTMVEAGGADRVPDLGAGCLGHITAAAPDLDLRYTAGAYRLHLYVRSTVDTTLVVNAPDGSWHCADDEDGPDPVVSFGRPQSGYYSIWVGTYGSATAAALLYISERDPRGQGAPPVAREIVSGSGFFVTAAGHLVTNAHVVESCSSIVIGDHGPARLVLADADSDLALLQLVAEAPGAGARQAPAGHAVFSTGGPRLGADVVLLGYPLADLLEGSLNVTTGVVSGLSGLGRDQRMFQLSAPLQQGNSGGPVLDEVGLVIGVAVAKLDEMAELGRSGSLPQNINFAIRSTVVLGFLERAGVAAQTAPGGTALSRTAISERGAGFTVQVACTI